MKWTHLLEADPIRLGPRLRKMWVDKLINAFMSYEKMDPKLTPRETLEAIAEDHRNEMSEFDSDTIIAISREVEKTLEAMDISTDWDIPTSYQVKASKVFKDFIDIRKTDLERRRIPDGLLFKLSLARAFTIKPTHDAMYRALGSDTFLREVHKKVLKRLTHLGYDVKGYELEIGPTDLALMRGK